MRAIDDWLIDRLFQPTADSLARWVSCYGIAAFLLTGALLFFGWRFLHERDWIGLLVTSIWLPVDVWRAYRQDAAPPSNVLPVWRLRHLFVRLLMLGTGLGMLFLAALAIWEQKYPVLLVHLVWWGIIAAYYFMACRKNPPSTRRSGVGLWRTARVDA